MNKKEQFIEMVENLIKDMDVDESAKYHDAIEYFNMFKAIKEVEKPKFTENGKRILQFMKDNKDKFNNMFKAKEIGEGLFISSKGASGSMRKLVTDGYAEKLGSEPVVYALTELGMTVEITEE